MCSSLIRMSLSVLTCVLLYAMMGGTWCDCMLENYTLWIEKQDCAQCATVNTTICSGYCHTQDTNVKGRVGKNYLIQRSCMPRSLVYHPARVPGCPLNVNPLLYYPESHHCHCRRCDKRTHHCVRTSRSPSHHCQRASRAMAESREPRLET